MDKQEDYRLNNDKNKQIEMFFKNFNILKIIFKWKFHLGAIVLITIIMGMVFSGSFFIKPKYKSFVLVYPSNISKYSLESETEQMLQWFESRDIADSMIQKFDLPQHYEIKKSDKNYNSKIYHTFNKNVVVSKTKFESVKITVKDTDPKIACDMANSMIDFYNKKVRNAHKEKYQEVLTIEKSRLNQKRVQLDSLMKIINNIRTKYELIDYGIQTNEVTRGYLGTFDGSSMAQINRKGVERLKHNIETKGDSLLLLTNQLSAVMASYSDYKISYEDAKRNVNKIQTFASIITSPFPADKKAYPNRLVIIVLAASASLVLSFLIIMIIEFVSLGSQNF